MRARADAPVVLPAATAAPRHTEVDGASPVASLEAVAVPAAVDGRRATAEPAGRAKPAGAPKKARIAETIRVDSDRLDHLMNLAGELVITKARFVAISRGLEELFRGSNAHDADLRHPRAAREHQPRARGPGRDQELGSSGDSTGPLVGSRPPAARQFPRDPGRARRDPRGREQLKRSPRRSTAWAGSPTACRRACSTPGWCRSARCSSGSGGSSAT